MNSAIVRKERRVQVMEEEVVSEEVPGIRGS